MTTPDPLLQGPATLVECPWCAEAVELEPGRDELTCRSCHVRVEIAPDPSPATRRLAA